MQQFHLFYPFGDTDWDSQVALRSPTRLRAGWPTSIAGSPPIRQSQV